MQTYRGPNGPVLSYGLVKAAHQCSVQPDWYWQLTTEVKKVSCVKIRILCKLSQFNASIDVIAQWNASKMHILCSYIFIRTELSDALHLLCNFEFCHLMPVLAQLKSSMCKPLVTYYNTVYLPPFSFINANDIISKYSVDSAMLHWELQTAITAFKILVVRAPDNQKSCGTTKNTDVVVQWTTINFHTPAVTWPQPLLLTLFQVRTTKNLDGQLEI